MNRLKTKYRSSLVALSFLVIGATTAFAQQESSTTTLSLQECREMALENNIESNIAKEQITAADYRVAAYKTNYLPKLSAAGTYLYSDAKFGRTIE
ncbi:MAG: TolC family protein, partial [Bacteroidales bacterium]|nr:TolC family protein [Bacteroidales bacterium]